MGHVGLYFGLFLTLSLKCLGETLFLRYWGNPFLALALVLGLERETRSRLLILGFTGLWEGFLSPAGILGGVVAALAVVHLQGFLLRKLNLSFWYPFLLAHALSLLTFILTLNIFFPYLIELSMPTNWIDSIFSEFILTYFWILVFLLLPIPGLGDFSRAIRD